MKLGINILLAGMLTLMGISCNEKTKQVNENQTTKSNEVTAKEILGNPNYPAISYGGYRNKTRNKEDQPTIDELKGDMKILSAMGIKVLRTYNVQFTHAFNLLIAIEQLKEEDKDFEMYVMLGIWIDCKNAWTGEDPDHHQESEHNEGEVARAAALANQFPEIVKVLAVGNEAMIRWAASYFVQPWVILKWVNHLQGLKQQGKLPADLWITSSDDFASWGGGDTSYRTEELEQLIKAVDYVSMHTYPYHNSHYNPNFWIVPESELELTDIEKVDAAMLRAVEFAKTQYQNVSDYVNSVAPGKPVHIGETGWATVSSGHYGPKGSRATDEYKQGLYYKHMRNWTNSAGISCFYFEAFDEQWKDSHNPKGSENHFGLLTIDGKAKYILWDLVDQGVFDGFGRNGGSITKTYEGDKAAMMEDVLVPPVQYEPVY
jgi:exo-beta-1,3-glucanase (GH17 family)